MLEKDIVATTTENELFLTESVADLSENNIIKSVSMNFELNQLSTEKELPVNEKVKNIIKNESKNSKTGKLSVINETDTNEVVVTNDIRVIDNKEDVTTDVESKLQVEQSIVESHINNLKGYVAYTLYLVLTKVTGTEFSQVHKISQHRIKYINTKVSKLRKIESNNLNMRDKIDLHLLCAEGTLWKMTCLKDYSKKDNISVKEILSNISDFYKRYAQALEKLVEYYEVLKNHGQLKLNKSFEEKYTKAEKGFEIFFKICLLTLNNILKICRYDSVTKYLKAVLEYCNKLFSGMEKKLQKYRKTLEHPATF